MKRKVMSLGVIFLSIIFLSEGMSQESGSKEDFIEGTLLELIMHSPALEDNFLGDSQDREVSVYLPPDYYSSPDKYYPVVYFLHGYFDDHTTFYGEANGYSMNFKTVCDELIGTKELAPMVVVTPNAYNKYGGSFYTNSIVTGNWENFITNDLVNYVERNFRTLPQSQSRGLAGHSMGGFGTVWLCMNFPGIFNSAYMHSGVLDLDHMNLDILLDWMIPAIHAESCEGLSLGSEIIIAQAAAFSPDTLAEHCYAQFPYNESGELVDSIWQKWLKFDPVTVLPTFRDSLLRLKAIQFDSGLEEWGLYQSRNFADALDSVGIEYTFIESPGGHTDKIAERIQTNSLPFFSANLSDTMITDTTFVNLIEWQGIVIKENYKLNETINLDTSRWKSDSISYEIISGDPENIFSIDELDNKIVSDTLTLDYELKNYYNLLIRADFRSDQELISDSANIFIRIENINDNPPVARDTIFHLPEDKPNGGTVGRVPATDNDGNSLSFQIINGNINETFSIYNNGLIWLANSEYLDYENISQYILSIAVTDGIFFDTASVTINVDEVVANNFPKTAQQLQIHPNPANDIFFIDIGNLENASIEIYSISGRLVTSKDLSSTDGQIGISGVPAGLYFVRVKHLNKVYIQKLVVR